MQLGVRAEAPLRNGGCAGEWVVVPFSYDWVGTLGQVSGNTQSSGWAAVIGVCLPDERVAKYWIGFCVCECDRGLPFA